MVSALAVMFLILGAGALYAYLIVTGREQEVPPAITLVLGMAIGQIGNLLLGRLASQQADGIETKIATNLDTTKQVDAKADNILKAVNGQDRQTNKEKEDK